jgi:uncharacterized caspase-like protein
MVVRQLFRFAASVAVFVTIMTVPSEAQKRPSLPVDRSECAAHDAAVATGTKQPRRIALSIGNAANAGHPLANAVNDSRLIAETLTKFGWEVVHHADLDRKKMLEALELFADQVGHLCARDTALFYFSGYGFEIDRISYIFPTDLDIRRKDSSKTEQEQDQVLAEAVSLKEIISAFQVHKGPKLIILDTCRDNPFQGRRREIDPDLLAAVRLPENTLYAYSAEPGDQALDVGPNPAYGPYAWSLSRAIGEIEGTAEQVFRRVRTEVVEFSSKGNAGPAYIQRPFVESSLSGEVYLGKQPAVATYEASRPRSASGGGTRGVGGGGGTAAPPKRIALVVANSDYATAGVLKNPINDAKAVAQKLRKLRFEVTEKKDLKHAEIEAALFEFGKLARKADWAMIYFAGHGMEVGGRTYLLPVDVKLERDVDADDEAVSLHKILEKVERTEGIGLIILDACRNNPFERSMRRMARRGRDAQSSGLGRVDLDSTGVLVAYSAKHGTVAQDGDGELSPFADALLKTIEQPGLEVNMLFRKVRDLVFTKTERQQEPYFYGSLPGREFYFVAPVAATATAAAPR